MICNVLMRALNPTHPSLTHYW